MSEQDPTKMIDITDDPNLWNRFYMPHSLIIIGSKEQNGKYNFAPKHMAMPLGFGLHFGFMGTPRKTTYQNIKREKAFTVSYPKPSQLIVSSLTASHREDDHSKPVIDEIPSVESQKIEGRFLKDSYVQLECTLSQMIGNFGEWEIVAGEIIAAYVHEDALRKDGDDRNDGNLIRKNPVLAYLHPDRFAVIKKSHAFPFPKDFKR